MFIPLCGGDRTGETNSRPAAGGHRSLSPAGRRAARLCGLDAHTCPQKNRRPRPFGIPPKARASVSSRTLDALVLSHLPAPLAGGRGAAPPTMKHLAGARLSLARRSMSCWRFQRGSPQASLRSSGDDASFRASAERLAPHSSLPSNDSAAPKKLSTHELAHEVPRLQFFPKALPIYPMQQSFLLSFRHAGKCGAPCQEFHGSGICR